MRKCGDELTEKSEEVRFEASDAEDSLLMRMMEAWKRIQLFICVDF